MHIPPAQHIALAILTPISKRTTRTLSVKRLYRDSLSAAAAPARPGGLAEQARAYLIRPTRCVATEINLSLLSIHSSYHPSIQPLE